MGPVLEVSGVGCSTWGLGLPELVRWVQGCFQCQGVRFRAPEIARKDRLSIRLEDGDPDIPKAPD